MSDPWFPDRSSARALLIGTACYDNGDLPAIEAVTRNLKSLKQALTDPDVGLLEDPDHCRVLPDPADQATVGAALAWAVQEADSLLLVYYAGHGVLDDDGLLHLALTTTDPEHVGFTAVPMELVKRNLGRARAKARVLLLDCCFSGRAVSAMAQPESLVSGQLDMTGTYTLTSTTATAPSHAPIGSTHTAFTGALLHALAAPVPLTLDGIHEHVDRELAGLGLPRPQRRSAGAANNLALVRGPVPDREDVTQRPAGEASFDMVRPPLAGAGNVGAFLFLALLTFGVCWLLVRDAWGFPTPAVAGAGLYILWLSYGRVVISYWQRMVVDADGLTVIGKQRRHQRAWKDIASLTLVEPTRKLPPSAGNAHLVVRLREGAEQNNEVHPLPNPKGGHAWYPAYFRAPTHELLAALRTYAPFDIRVARKQVAPPARTDDGTPVPSDPDHTLKRGEEYRGPRRRSALVFLALTAATAGSAEYLDRRNTPVTLEGHTDTVACVGFNSDGSLLASGGNDKTVRLWDPHTHNNTRTLTGHEWEIQSVHFADAYTVVSSDGSTLRSWDVNGSRSPVVITTPWGRLNEFHMAAGPGEPSRADHQHEVFLWDVRTGQLQGSLSGHSAAVNACDWSGYEHLVSGSRDGTVRLWDVTSRTNIATLRGHSGSVDAVLFGPNGDTVISVGDDGTVRVWDINTRGVLAIYRTGTITSLGYGNSGKTLYSADSSGRLRFWDLTTRKPTFTARTDPLSSDSLSSRGGTLVLGQEGNVRLIDMSTGRSRTLPVPFMPWAPSAYFNVNATAITSDRATIAGGCDDNRIRLWKKDG
ncbi:caspase, EACC1-associated type [Streptomyces sp. 900105755]